MKKQTHLGCPEDECIFPSDLEYRNYDFLNVAVSQLHVVSSVERKRFLAELWLCVVFLSLMKSVCVSVLRVSGKRVRRVL